MALFSDLGLSPEILSALERLKFIEPTEIQEQSIPALIEKRRDFIGIAQTGTGKTAAFGLPLLQQLNPKQRSIQALILAPTRELGQQIAGQIKDFSSDMPRIAVQCVYGGAAITTQISALRKNPQIVVATPGRLLDLMRRKAIRIDEVNFVILDEADEMLNMGFREELDAILQETPDSKVTWLFSATMPGAIRKMVQRDMTDPLEVTISPKSRVNENIEHQYVIAQSRDRVDVLRRFMDNQPDLFGVAFCRTKLGTQQVAMKLSAMGYRAEAIHGDLSQQQRNQVMQRFKSGHVQLLVATDVAARGIDVNDLTHVIHYDLPVETESYTHRSGRTARAGKKGISLSLLGHNEVHRLKRIQKALGIAISPVQIPTVKEILVNRAAEWAAGLALVKPHTTLTDEMMERANAALVDIPRDELIRKYLSMELGKLGYKGQDKDFNTQGGGKEDFKGKGGSPRSSDWVRYFINMGSMDQINKADLVRFISESTKLDSDFIGDVTLMQKHSYFDIAKAEAPKVMPAFKDLEVNGRELRVNLDSDGPTQSKDRRKSWPHQGGGRGNARRGGPRRGGKR